MYKRIESIVYIKFSPAEYDAVMKATEIAKKHKHYVYFADDIQDVYARVFEVHGCLTSAEGGDTICKLLDELKELAKTKYDSMEIQ
jgi:hypothetical protein